ncbi:MAG: hypothetical protein R6U10_01795 [Thermoplasmatota archaeon]
MAQTVVTCPNCETSFEVDVNATRGKCPSCSISLIYEDVPAARQTPQPPEPSRGGRKGQKQEKASTPQSEQREQPDADVVEETVDIGRVEAAVDAIVERTVTDRKTRAADIAAVESIEPERDYSDVDKKVEKLLSRE